MRLGRLLLVVAAAAAAQALAASPARATSCGLVVEWEGRTYSETRHRGQLVYGRTLGNGTIPACDPGEGDRDESVAVAPVRGVDPQYAVVVAERVFVAEGYPVTLRQHPVHDLVYGSRDEPDERRNCQPQTSTIDGDVASAPTFWLSLEGRADPIALDAQTAVSGLPELNEGDRVRVETLTCEGEGAGTTLAVAASLELLVDVQPGEGAGFADRDVVLAVAVTGLLFAAAFAVRRARRRGRFRPSRAG